jgi:tetratricopeptide (TPR) repeat protein
MIEIEQANELFLRKKFEAAIKKYDFILRNEPDNLLALNNKGYSFSKLRKYQEAISCYDEYLSIKPNDSIVLINKISIFRKIGELNKALELCNLLLNNNFNERIVLYHKLRILKKLGKFLESNLLCQKILRTYPNNGDVLYDMASNFLNMNMIDDFFRILEKAVSVMPNLKNKCKSNKEFKQFHANKRFLDIISQR